MTTMLSIERGARSDRVRNHRTRRGRFFIPHSAFCIPHLRAFDGQNLLHDFVRASDYVSSRRGRWRRIYSHKRSRPGWRCTTYAGRWHRRKAPGWPGSEHFQSKHDRAAAREIFGWYRGRPVCEQVPRSEVKKHPPVFPATPWADWSWRPNRRRGGNKAIRAIG